MGDEIDSRLTVRSKAGKAVLRLEAIECQSGDDGKTELFSGQTMDEILIGCSNEYCTGPNRMDNPIIPNRVMRRLLYSGRIEESRLLLGKYLTPQEYFKSGRPREITWEYSEKISCDVDGDRRRR